MISAKEAAKQTAESIVQMTNVLAARLQEVISASIKQGSCKATFYPKNKFEAEHAVLLLENQGFTAKLHLAADQRDNDRIEIDWSERQ